MPCAAFEERLLAYDDLDAVDRRPLDAHLAGCAGCRAFLGALEEVDRALESLAPRQVPPQFRNAVLHAAQRQALLRKPSPLPEFLDFVGGAAVLAIAAYLLDVAVELYHTAMPA